MLDTELETLPRLISEAAEPLPEIDDEFFGAFFDRYADARVICLGEASHGTSEFYRARAAISRRLIEHHGFNIVAVEGDWPDCATIDRYVRHRPARDIDFEAFGRFPMWMWRNREVDPSSLGCAVIMRSAPRSGCAAFTGSTCIILALRWPR